jgi:hypothetical protein
MSRLAVVSGGALLMLGVSGCTSEVADEGEDIGEVQSAIVTKEFTDVTGTIKVRVKTCDWVTATRPNAFSLYTANATCGVDTASGYVLVGGGGEIENSPNPGALLKGSRPDPNFGVNYTRWIAHSSQYAVSNQTHRLRAYSIGLRLVGLSAAELQSNVLTNDSTTTLQTDPTITAFANSWQLMIGGGATVQPDSAAMFLVESRPDTTVAGWTATLGNNGGGATGAVKAYVTGINPCPVRANGSQWGCLTTSELGGGASGPGGYIEGSEYESPDGSGRFTYMMTSVGATTYSDTSAKRYVTDILPTKFIPAQTEGVTVWSKNTSVNAGGGVTAWMSEIRKL